MNCKTTVEMLSAYLDRELGTPERDAVRAHLADCGDCRIEERELRALKGLLLGVRAPEPAYDFEQRLITRLHQEASRPIRTPVFPRMRPLAWGQLGGLAATAAMALVAFTRLAPRSEVASTAHASHEVALARVSSDDVTDKYVAYSGADAFAGGTSMLTDGP